MTLKPSSNNPIKWSNTLKQFVHWKCLGTVVFSLFPRHVFASLTHFMALIWLYTPLKTSKNLLFSIFPGVLRKINGIKCVKTIILLAMMVLKEEKRDIFQIRILVGKLFEYELIWLQVTACNYLESFFT